MSRKDTILIAVIINAGLLAVLFATAIIYDTDKILDQLPDSTDLVQASPIKEEPSLSYIASANPAFDEMDHEIKNYMEPLTSAPEEEDLFFKEPVAEIKAPVVAANEKKAVRSDYVDVIVKKGDSLEKIAKAHRTTIESIKNANHLATERLSIGQMLRVPLKNDVAPIQTKPVAVVPPVPEQPEVVYHIVKSGDSPWKIAKLYGVNYEQILKLNHLDEDKARNIKIGDRIRVK